jgi:glycogen synthase
MSTPIRVLAVGTCYPPRHLGGYEVIWQGVTRELRAAGHETRVLVTDYRQGDADAGEPEDPEVYRELDWYWRDHEWRSLRARERLALERHNAQTFDRHVREFRPDVVTWWPVGGLSLGLIERARRAGRPAVLFVLDPWLAYGPRHDLWIRMWSRLGPLAGLGGRVTGLPSRVDYGGAGRWVFCSRQMRDDSFAGGLRTDDWAVIEPGVATALLDAPEEPEPPPWRWRLLYIGRVVEQKGVETAIESLARLPTQAELRIVGPGDRPYRSRLEHLAASLGLAERVRFEGPRPRAELIGVYRGADAVLFPVTWAEPWGLVPLEAMALGRPVLATGRGGSGEYLADRQNALLFDAGDAAGLAAAVESLAGDDRLREELRRGGRETAELHSEMRFNQRAVAEILSVASR